MSTARIPPLPRPLSAEDVAGLMKQDASLATTPSLALQFRVQDLFPPTDRLSSLLLMLAGVTNDALLLQKLIVQRMQWSREQNGIEPVLMLAEISYFARLLCGHLYEAGIVWRDTRPVIGKALDELRGEPDTRQALEQIEQSLGDENASITKQLCVVRNQGTFHCDPREFNRIVNDATRMGQMIVTGLAGFNRYTLADQILDDVVQKATHRDPEEQRALVLALINIAAALARVVAALLWVRIREKQECVTVVSQWVVKIPPALQRGRARIQRARESRHEGQPS